MAQHVKGFVTCDSYIDNRHNAIAPLYEISAQGLTYAKEKQQYFSTSDPRYSLYVFYSEQDTLLEQAQINAAIEVVTLLVNHFSANRTAPKHTAIVTFMNHYNLTHADSRVSDLVVSGLIDTGDTVAPDYVTFKVMGVEFSLWLSDSAFRGFYPHYEIDIVLPFVDFAGIVRNGAAMIEAASEFNLVEFNKRIEDSKQNRPTTYTAILNIPYRLPNSTVTRDMYFAFNQYGSQGNYDYVLKLKLYEYLLSLGLESGYIESIFPTILQINEFFITPRWASQAIPSRVGQNAVMSQISKAYDTQFDLDRFIKVYSDVAFLRNHSYNVPYDYNNLLLTVTDGLHTDPAVQDFRQVYGDLITVTSQHPDFSRMSRKTMRLVTVLENMLSICDVDSSSALFTRMMDNENYDFNILTRQGVSYLSVQFEGHQLYMIPKFEYLLRDAA